MKQVHTVGWLAEQKAGQFLANQGCRLLHHRFKCYRLGEIDWIVRDQNVLAFVEVRYRKHTAFGDAITSVDARKQQKLIQVAAYFLNRHGQHHCDTCRFDVLGIDGCFSNIIWIKQAFTA